MLSIISQKKSIHRNLLQWILSLVALSLFVFVVLVGWIVYLLITDFQRGTGIFPKTYSSYEIEPSSPIVILDVLYELDDSNRGFIENNDIIKYDVPAIQMPSTEIINLNHKICIDRIHTYGTNKDIYLRPNYPPTYEFRDLCSGNDRAIFNFQEENIILPDNIISSAEVVDWSSTNWIAPQGHALTRFYPFDTREAIITTWLDMATDNGNTFSTAPEMSVSLKTPNWHPSVSFDKIEIYVGNEIKNITITRIELKRPLGIRVLTTVLLIALFGFILILIFIPDTGSVLEVSVGILLGLWGIPGILIPSYIVRDTIVHTIILILYLVFACAIVIRFIGRPTWDKIWYKENDLHSSSRQKKQKITCQTDSSKSSQNEDVRERERLNADTPRLFSESKAQPKDDEYYRRKSSIDLATILGILHFLSLIIIFFYLKGKGTDKNV